MNFIIWLVVGGLIGWIASKIMNTNAQQGIALNIVVGIVGSILGGWLISPDAYRKMLVEVADRTANASKEGGFLGFGGVRVSDEEQAFISEVRRAAGLT